MPRVRLLLSAMYSLFGFVLSMYCIIYDDFRTDVNYAEYLIENVTELIFNSTLLPKVRISLQLSMKIGSGSL